MSPHAAILPLLLVALGACSERTHLSVASLDASVDTANDAPPRDATAHDASLEAGPDASDDAPTGVRVPYVRGGPDNRLITPGGAVFFVTRDKVRWGWGDRFDRAMGRRLFEPFTRRYVPERVTLDEENYYYDLHGQNVACRWPRRGGGPVQCWGDEGQYWPARGRNILEEPTDMPFRDADLVETQGCASRSDGVWCWGIQYSNYPPQPATRRYDRPFCAFTSGWADRLYTRCGYDCERQQIACLGEWVSWRGAEEFNESNFERYAYIVPARDAVAIGGAGGTTFYIVRSDGSLWCRGSCGGDRIGTFGLPHDDLRRMEGLPPVVFADGLNAAPGRGSDTTRSCALLRDGTVTCWGTCAAGLGGPLDCSPSDASRLYVVERVGGLHDVVELSMDSTMACVRTSEDQVWCWGRNGSHAVDPTSERQMIWEPVRVIIPRSP